MAVPEVVPLNTSQFESAAKIRALHVAAYAQEAQLASVFSLPPMERSVAELQAVHERFFGIFVQGNPAAAVSINSSPDGQVEICSLAVHPTFQRLGLGRTMLKFVVATAGSKHVLVSTAAANYPALSLYRAEGFVEFKRSFVSSPPLEITHLHRQSPNLSVKGTGLRPAPYLER